MKIALVCGAGGFIGGHLVRQLKQQGFWVRGVDLKFNEFSETEADDFVIGDLRNREVCDRVVDRRSDDVYQLAADMGGAGYILIGEHDADIMHNIATINSNIAGRCNKRYIKRVFYSSFACTYPAYNQEDRTIPVNECVEGTILLTRSAFSGPVNIGSQEMVTINQLVDLVADVSGKRVEKNHIDDEPLGGRGRSSDNRLIQEKLGWKPSQRLRAGFERTCEWIEQQAMRNTARG